MPIYEYVCRDCGDQFEWLVRTGEAPTCPSCGRSELAKQLSVPAAHVAGAREAICPAHASGACQEADCRGGRCGFADGR